MRILCFAVLSLALVGCSSKKTVPLEGTVSINGKAPPAGTKVVFSPVDGKNDPMTATTDEQGSFKTNGQVGKYMVYLRAPTDTDKEFYKTVPKSAYEDGTVTDVTEGGSPIVIRFDEKKKR